MSSPNPPRFRIVADTNVLVRGILSPTGGSALILEAIKRGRCQFIAARPLLRELYAVLGRPRIARKYGITPKQRKRLVAQLYIRSFFVQPRGHLHICRDPKDDYVIEMAILGRATHLVSEDGDLHTPDIVALLQSYGVRVTTVARFLVELAHA